MLSFTKNAFVLSSLLIIPWQIFAANNPNSCLPIDKDSNGMHIIKIDNKPAKFANDNVMALDQRFYEVNGVDTHVFQKTGEWPKTVTSDLDILRSSTTYKGVTPQVAIDTLYGDESYFLATVKNNLQGLHFAFAVVFQGTKKDGTVFDDYHWFYDQTGKDCSIAIESRTQRAYAREIV